LQLLDLPATIVYKTAQIGCSPVISGNACQQLSLLFMRCGNGLQIHLRMGFKFSDTQLRRAKFLADRGNFVSQFVRSRRPHHAFWNRSTQRWEWNLHDDRHDRSVFANRV